MTDIRFFCPACRGRLAVDGTVAGYNVDCPKCGKWIQIPMSSDPAMGVTPPAEPVPGQTLTREEITYLSRAD